MEQQKERKIIDTYLATSFSIGEKLKQEEK